ncbi:hypothetical protein K457DRAFT_1862803 [Linnemannia elongata AG-77]|uniref:Uncharacterized protein n=1 Tax=Linnemannia elongata AG-77 TaxID=1314771 RepID=A0A197K4B5_9FUNG|nr:hypothetical protein K457DRAFT_1862803 [Linnemannia elongata AG-77]
MFLCIGVMSVDVEEDVEVGVAGARSEHTIGGEVYVFVREKGDKAFRDGKDVLLLKLEVLEASDNEMKDKLFAPIDVGEGEFCGLEVELLVRSEPVEDAGEWSSQAKEDPELGDGIIGGGGPPGRVGLETMEQVWVEVLLKVWHSSQTLDEVEA